MKKISLIKDTKVVLDRLYASYKLGDRTITTKEYADAEIGEDNNNEKSGKGDSVAWFIDLNYHAIRVS